LGLKRGLEGARQRVTALPFGLRLFGALLVSLTLVGAISYELISHRLHDNQLDDYAEAVAADAASFEKLARQGPVAGHLREIDNALKALAGRPAAEEAVLIGPDGRVAAAPLASQLGKLHLDPRVRAALGEAESYAGSEVHPGQESDHFELVGPVELPDGRYALEMSFNRSQVEGHLNSIETVLLTVGGGGVLCVLALFYLLGGRTLLRSHRLALQRSTRDGLTDLPNQRAFQADLTQAVAASQRHGDPFALAVFDVDQFKLINDRKGHPAGDAVLCQIAEVIRAGRTSDRGYRIGGDEFALLLTGTDEPGAVVWVERLLSNLRAEGINLSVGVALERGERAADELRAEADAALYEAKRRGGDRFVSFEEIRGQTAITTAAKRAAVRTLVAGERFSTAFQPIWDLGAERLIGVEALTRPDPDLPITEPAQAFDIAEEIGCVHDLDVACVRQALRSVPPLPEGARLFLNLAPRTLEQDAGECDWLLDEVESAGLDPDRLVIEVTERIGARTKQVVRSLTMLRRHGCQIALDDVGTGNSGLEVLRQVGAEFVKIDRSIVTSAATEPNARAVLLAMATFARQTGAFVIAEGIEDEATLAFLADLKGVDIEAGTVIQGGQGFALGYPSPGIPDPQATPARRSF
jgi:diguanylate cyclase (GGDEF)-like protein